MIRERYGLDAGPQRGRTTYLHRTYLELQQMCLPSKFRIRQVEKVAPEKLRQVLGPHLTCL